jgi:hypothetical protein
MTSLTDLYRRATGLAERLLPASVLLLVARLGIASIFFLSGRTKVSGLLTITDSAYYLFETDYRLPFLSPHVAAHIATYSEHLSDLAGPWPRHALCRVVASGHDHGDRGFRLSRCLASPSVVGRTAAPLIARVAHSPWIAFSAVCPERGSTSPDQPSALLVENRLMTSVPATIIAIPARAAASSFWR